MPLEAQEPGHTFFEEKISKDDYVFRIKRPRPVAVSADGTNLVGTFLVYINATTSPVIIEKRNAFSISLYQGDTRIGDCEVMYEAPGVAEVVGGSIVFFKDKVTRLVVTGLFPVKNLNHSRPYRMHIEVIRSRYDGYAKVFVPPKDALFFWSGSCMVQRK